MVNEFSFQLILWYEVNKRDLPWRNTRDPYLIWVSEIILQQTRVSQGLDYYIRFIQNFPNVRALSQASEQQVLNTWQGLGYYSRARNMHKASKRIVEQYNGVFPNSYEAIIGLPGIGEYTASAIASFAYELPHAVLDGNVFRVLSRYYGLDLPIDTSIGKSYFQNLAFEVLNKTNPSTHNQAIMEFGALQCVPVNPKCEKCVLKNQCFAWGQSKVDLLPVKVKKTKVRDRYFSYLVVYFKESIFLVRRTKNDIWKGLFEFPLIETDKVLDYSELIGNNEFLKLTKGIETINFQTSTPVVKHKLSHQTIHARFFYFTISNINSFFKELIRVADSELGQYPMSKLVQNYSRFSKINEID